MTSELEVESIAGRLEMRLWLVVDSVFGVSRCVCFLLPRKSFVTQQNETPGSKDTNKKGKGGENIAGYGAEMANIEYILEQAI